MMRGWIIVAVAVAAAALALGLRQGMADWLRHYRAAFTAGARYRMDAFFLAMDLSRFWLGALLAAWAAGLAAYAWTGSWWVCGGLSAALLVLPRGLLRWGWQRRRRQLTAQLPELLLGLAWALRGGASLPGALRAVVLETEPPTRQEFGLLLREQRMGVSFEQALANLYQRVPTPELALVVAVLGIAAQSGGNLADALQGLADTVEARLRTQRRLRAMTSQGVLQAWIMGALPLVLLASLQWLEPQAMHGLWHTPSGWLLLGILALLLAIGFWFIRRIVSIRP
ncbi:type II secretion system F family protein [Kerstersia similis]|uniref:type II secretion system F family protein n=1 Tax=Kerstersia similis TaxID=206505 RepID=UPI0039EEAB29